MVKNTGGADKKNTRSVAAGIVGGVVGLTVGIMIGVAMPKTTPEMPTTGAENQQNESSKSAGMAGLWRATTPNSDNEYQTISLDADGFAYGHTGKMGEDELIRKVTYTMADKKLTMKGELIALCGTNETERRAEYCYSNGVNVTMVNKTLRGMPAILSTDTPIRRVENYSFEGVEYEYALISDSEAELSILDDGTLMDKSGKIYTRVQN